MFISRLIIKSLTSLRLLGHVISEINGKNWLDSHCKRVMLEMSLEMRNTQYILGLVNGMLHPLSLSTLCSFFFFSKTVFLFYFIYLHKQHLACELQHSRQVNCKCWLPLCSHLSWYSETNQKKKTPLIFQHSQRISGAPEKINKKNISTVISFLHESLKHFREALWSSHCRLFTYR